eukprot:1326158-Amorphochlora_amoeboformis.AAC.1
MQKDSPFQVAIFHPNPTNINGVISVQGCSRQLKKSVSERMGLLPLPIADRILNGVHIKLVGMEDFIETFAVLLEESGASICRKLSRKCDYLMLEPRAKFSAHKSTIDLARSYGVKVVQASWLREILTEFKRA